MDACNDAGLTAAGEMGNMGCRDTIEIPLLGEVAAGAPYQAFAVEETLNVPTTLWAGKRVFALRVRGKSMIDEGIHHGDYLIVEPRPVADNGQTVVAEIDGCVTVKKYYREADGRVRLQPANPEMLPLTMRGDHVRIIGVVAGVLRKFGFGDGRRAAGMSKGSGTGCTRSASGVRRAGGAVADTASIDLEVNVMDSQLIRWESALARARQDRRLVRHVARMEELGRDLQTLREWCARTNKPGLRRALLLEANKVMRRMQRFASTTTVRLPDLVLH
ncbi:MAG: transcriptional repressor LexA [Candidatus Binatia bacterium]